MRSVSDIDLAYIAGMMDGEGSLSLYPRQGRGNWTRTLIAIANNNRDVLDWIAETVGLGKVYSKKKKASDTTNYVFETFSTDGRQFVPAILPFLRIKKRQAEVLLTYWKILDTYPNTKAPERKVAIDALIDEMRYLNPRASKWKMERYEN